MVEDLMQKIVALCKRRGFIFPGSEIYGGLGGTWDYGPTGSLLKKNFKDWWWEEMVTLRDDVVGVDAAIMMNPTVWEASGHVASFADTLVECKICHIRLRIDKEEEKKEHEEKHRKAGEGEVVWTDPKRFSTLVSAQVGVIEGDKTDIFLRGEITAGVHVNFRNVVDSSRVRIPFGIAQMGRAFRNEITPGNFVFRSREFEQVEVQFYVRPDEDESMKWFEYWKQNRMEWFLKLGFKKERLRFRDHRDDERAHYAKAATDIEYEAPWGWDEMMGIHHRSDWDLKRHQEYSGKDLTYRDPETGESYIPWDIETSSGVDRPLMFLLMDAYVEEPNRIVLKLHPRLAPYKVAVFPLVKNKPEIVDKARDIFKNLKEKKLSVAWDERGNIGKRYLAQDEIGTPWCVTVDYQTLEDDTITIRDRDTTRQERVAVDKLETWLRNQLSD
jgi:glycyl-tRNA synthetase